MWGADDKIVGLWNLTNCACGDGVLYDYTVVGYTNGIAPGQELQLYWFPSLTLASNTLGVTYYGKYTDTNSPPLDGSDVWEMPAGGTSVDLRFWTAFWDGSNPETAGQATNLTVEPLLANFTGSPTSGTEPLSVTFTDTSTGTISNRFWDFGDGGTTSITTNVVIHMYAAGIYGVTLIVTSPDGVSTNTKPGYIKVLTPFQQWQIQYFGSATCVLCGGNADFDGDGMSNTNEFLSGTDPTNSASAFRITGIAQESDDVRVTWTMGSDKTNALQVATGDAGGSFTNDFADLFTVTNTVGSVTNYLDSGGATNSPARFYRVRLVP
jgi:PKD repeat protein